MTAIQKRHAHAARGHDYYRTAPEAVEALLEIEAVPYSIWEPACGDGAIVRPLRAAGRLVYASDIVDRGCPDSTSPVDFLTTRGVPRRIGGIITNPPYMRARAFVDRALAIVDYVAMLLRLTFLESEKRMAWLQASPLAPIHVSSARLPGMHRDGWEGLEAPSQFCYAWFIWDRRHDGPPNVFWFNWRNHLILDHGAE